jgi:hypothetical protein
MVALKGLRSRTREHAEVPLGSAFIEAEDVKGAVAALDFAITVIGTVPVVEDFDHLDPIHVQPKRPGYLNPMILTGLDHNAHVSASVCSASIISAVYSFSPCASC